MNNQKSLVNSFCIIHSYTNHFSLFIETETLKVKEKKKKNKTKN